MRSRHEQYLRRLTELYRTAAEALERDGNIEQAAFVLADLLSDPAAAVNLLERHGSLRMAADLARRQAVTSLSL